jgi:ubiquinone/menaquinone biosynthesis C-methylase UbiE
VTSDADLTLEGVIRIYNGVNDGVEEGDDSANYHIGGAYANDALCDKMSELNVDETWHVLDLCCGWGGGSQHVARRFGCRVLGIDLNSRSVQRARDLVRGTEVESLVEFQQGNALDLQLDSGSVDLIWSQEAFCHIPDRPRLFSECYRVLRPDGHLVFTDYLRGEYMTEAEYGAQLAYWSFPSLETSETYPSLLREAGFDVVGPEDVGREYMLVQEDAGLEKGRPTWIHRVVQASLDAANTIEAFGQERYVRALELQKQKLYVAQAKLVIGRSVCIKRTAD